MVVSGSVVGGSVVVDVVAAVVVVVCVGGRVVDEILCLSLVLLQAVDMVILAPLISIASIVSISNPPR